MISKKKAQMSVGQIFTYIIAIFIVAFVLLMGYRAIAGLREKGQEADYLQFKSQLAAAVKLTKGYGDASQESFSVPGNYKEVCFANSDITGPPFTNPDYSIIKNSIDSKVKKNIFLVKNNQEIDSFFIDDLKPLTANQGSETYTLLDSNNPCVPLVSGKLKLLFVGRGDLTEISTLT